MPQKPFRIRVTFAAKNLIAVNRELIEEILLFLRRLLHERREPGFERLQLSRMNFEIWMETLVRAGII